MKTKNPETDDQLDYFRLKIHSRPVLDSATSIENYKQTTLILTGILFMEKNKNLITLKQGKSA